MKQSDQFRAEPGKTEILYYIGGKSTGPILGVIFGVLYGMMAFLTLREDSGPGQWLYLGVLLVLMAGLVILLGWQYSQKIVLTPETVSWYRGKRCFRSCGREEVQVIFYSDFSGIKNAPPVLGMFGGTEAELTELGEQLVAEGKHATRCTEQAFQRMRTSGTVTRDITRSIPFLTERLGSQKKPYPWKLFYFEYSEERERLLREEFPETEFIRLRCI